MRKLVILGWLAVPVVAAAYHLGPGQERLRLDDASRFLAKADRHADAGRWDRAVASHDRALSALPRGRVAEARRVRIERAKALMFDHRLPAAAADLLALVEEMRADPAAEPEAFADARAAFAASQYYLAWLMKVEGIGRD